MRKALNYCLLAILLTFAGSSAFGTESIYTWTDQHGVIHMTNKQPPKGVTVEDRIDYLPQPDVSQPTVQSRIQTEESSEELKRAQALAVRERQKATTARREAQSAIEQAEQQVKDATAYYEKVKNKALKRKSLRIKIEKQFEAADNAKLRAEQLNLLAIEAERSAKEAEEKVQRLRNPEE
jgi:hypothetical protein